MTTKQTELLRQIARAVQVCADDGQPFMGVRTALLAFEAEVDGGRHESAMADFTDPADPTPPERVPATSHAPRSASWSERARALDGVFVAEYLRRRARGDSLTAAIRAAREVAAGPPPSGLEPF